MLQPAELKKVAEETAELMSRHQVSFERGEPGRYFMQIGQLGAGLTLPIVPREHEAKVVLLKNLFALWNIIVDDEIDRQRSKTHLELSAQVLLAHSLGRADEVPDSSAAKILNHLLVSLPGGRPASREAFLFDVREVMNGFHYEYFINGSVGAANSLEYGKYSTMTASIKPYLDMDFLFSEGEVEPATYARLRVAYEHFSLAIKYASDVGSLKRELSEEDNLNLVRIKAMEAGVLAPDRRFASEQEYEAIVGRLLPFIEEARRLARESLAEGNRALAGVSTIDTSLVVRSVSRLVEVYASSIDPFFNQQPR